MRRPVVVALIALLVLCAVGIGLAGLLGLAFGRSHAVSAAPPRKVSPSGRDGSALVFPAAGKVGFWRKLERSPDLRWWLGQWSGECEAQSAWLIPADGEKPKSVLPVSAESYALGWSGKQARIQVPRPVCGSNSGVEAGVYLVAPDTLKLTLVRRIKSSPAGP